MLEKLKNHWDEFKDAEVGYRFQDRYERCQREADSKRGKLFNILLGIIVVVAGLFMIPAPGPGAIIAALGLSLLGSEFEPLAKFLDAAELRLRPPIEKAMRWWQRTSFSFKGAVSLLALICAAGLAYGAYHFLNLGARWS